MNVQKLAWAWVDGFDARAIVEDMIRADEKLSNDGIAEYVRETEQNARQTDTFASIASALNGMDNPEEAWDEFEREVQAEMEALVFEVTKEALEWLLDVVWAAYKDNGGNRIVDYVLDLVRSACDTPEDAVSYLETLDARSGLPGLIYTASVEAKRIEWADEIKAFLEEYREASGMPLNADERDHIFLAVEWYASEVACRLRALI